MRTRALALRPLQGFLAGAVATAAIGLGLRPLTTVPDAVPALSLVVPVLLTAIAAGRRAALGVAIVAAAAFAFDFIDPAGSFLIGTVEGFLALAVFVTVAVVVGSLVGREAGGVRRRDLTLAHRVRDQGCRPAGAAACAHERRRRGRRQHPSDNGNGSSVLDCFEVVGRSGPRLSDGERSRIRTFLAGGVTSTRRRVRGGTIVRPAEPAAL